MEDVQQGTHSGPDHRTYIAVFVALAVFTLLSFIVREAEHWFGLSALVGAGIILGVAVIKAALVAGVFMHLRWDWRKLYFLILPAVILATMTLIALLPDLVFAWR